MRFTGLILLIVAASVRADVPPAKDTIAVMEFNAANASSSDASTLSGFVRGAVVRSGKYLVVEKKNMDKILAEQAFQQTGCTSSECAVKLGKILNSRKMIVGEYTVLDGIRFLTASLVDVETGQIEATAKVKGFDLGSADEATDRLVAKLTGVALAAESDSTFHPAVPAKPRRPRAIRDRFSAALGAKNYALGWKIDLTGASMLGVPHTGLYSGATTEGSARATAPELTVEYWRTFSDSGFLGFGLVGGVLVPNPPDVFHYRLTGTPTTGRTVIFSNDMYAGAGPGAQGEGVLFWNLKSWLNVLAGVNVSMYSFGYEWGGYDDGTVGSPGVGHFGSGTPPRGTVVFASGEVGVELFPFEHFSARITGSFGPSSSVHFAPTQQFGDVGGTADLTVSASPILETKLLINF